MHLIENYTLPIDSQGFLTNSQLFPIMQDETRESFLHLESD